MKEKLIPGVTDFATKFPSLVAEVHPTKNTGFDPGGVLPGSNKKIWWLCPVCGNEWEAMINSRTRGSGCKNCALKRRQLSYKSGVVARRGSLAESKLPFLDEWDYQLNKKTPADYTIHSGEKVHWICSKCGHKWEASIAHRSDGRGCPKCAQNEKAKKNRVASAQQNNLEMLAHDFVWISEWNTEKNLPLTLSDLAPQSHTTVWWRCRVCNHEWQAAPHERIQGRGCPNCGYQYQVSEPELVCLYYIKKLCPDVISGFSAEWLGRYNIDIFIPSLKIAVEYDGKLFHGNTKRDTAKGLLIYNHGIALFRIRERPLARLQDHSEQFFIDKNNDDLSPVLEPLSSILKSIASRLGETDLPLIDIKKDYNEIIAPIINRKKEKSLAAQFPGLLADWDYEKNAGISPFIISSGSTERVFWKCHICGYEWQTSINHRTSRGTGCKMCRTKSAAKNRVAGMVQRRGSLESNRPELAAEWDHENNTFTPDSITTGSNKYAHWICSACGHRWEAMICYRKDHPKCPKCRHIPSVPNQKD